MKYKGHELEEITEPIAYKEPREMLVWGTYDAHAHKERISAVTIQNTGVYAVSWHGNFYSHCAEIPEEPKPRRATNREVSRWLAQGIGEYTWEHDKDIRHHFFGGHSYVHGHEDELVDDAMRVRKWDDTDWHEPTVEYLGLEA